MLAASTSTEILEHLQEMQVTIDGYFYRVDFGPEVSPRSHRADRDQRCTCSLGESCPAVLAVIEYLAEGGEPPPEPPPGYYPVAPVCCPVLRCAQDRFCGAAAFFDLALSSRVRGAGWRCQIGGSLHYWEDRGRILALKFARQTAIMHVQSEKKP